MSHKHQSIDLIFMKKGTPFYSRLFIVYERNMPMVFRHGDDLHVLGRIFAMSISHDIYCQQEAIMSNTLTFKSCNDFIQSSPKKC